MYDTRPGDRRLALLLLVGLAAFGCAAARPAPTAPAHRQPGPAPATSAAAAAPLLPHPGFGASMGGPATATIADIAERVTPSVVSVSSSKAQSAETPWWPFQPWGRPGGGKQQGLGSGVVVRPGVIVTNNHVVEDADTINVASYDGREYSAEVVGTDPKSDLAVLRVHGDSSALRPIQLGDSSRLRLGDVVLAIGNPFGVGQTVTMGIVSAKGRAGVGIIDYEDFIQTDAAINPGNSGGALVDMEGKLVGINTAILSRSGGYQGIGFAIPTNMAGPIIDSLLRYGKVVRGWLGVSIQAIDQDLAKALGLRNATGVLVSDVGPDTPAARAGLRRGDVVLAVDGKPVDSPARLRNLIAIAGASTTVVLEVLREGKRVTVRVALGEMPGEESGPVPPRRSPSTQPGTTEGLSLEPLTPALREQHEIAPSITHGVVVTGVQSGSSAARAGLRPGDVLLELNRVRVTDVRQFRRLWSRSPAKVLLLLHRAGRTVYVVVDR
jgi:serine protease Do